MRIIIAYQTGRRPNEGMIMSSVPCFGAPGGPISDVVAEVLSKHVFTAMFAQPVAFELRKHMLS